MPHQKLQHNNVNITKGKDNNIGFMTKQTEHNTPAWSGKHVKPSPS